MDNMSIQSHLRSLSGMGQLPATPELSIIKPSAAPGEDAPQGASFKDTLAQSIDKVNNLMNASDQSIDDLATGKSTNIHHTLIGLQKADISFRMLVEVRNKVIKAYEEVMRMQA